MASEEKTEEATPKRREKAREEGQISKSTDLNSALMISIGMALLFTLMPFIISSLQQLIKYTFTHLHPDNIHPENILGLIAPHAEVVAKIMLPFLLLLFVSAFIIIRWQVGHLVSFKAVQPKFDKLSPSGVVKGFKNSFNIFSPQKLVELAKSLIKMLVVFAFGYTAIANRKDELLALLGVDLATASGTISSILTQMITNMCIAMLFIGIIDKKFQDHQYDKKLKMSKEEVKDERKQADGDPHVKGKIKAAQYKFAQQKMISNVPEADVVVTNPTHFAVALRYNTEIAPAPQVIAKGQDYIAFKIKDIAKNNNIPIVENKPLARTLHKVVPLDGMIPPELYVAVAEVLAFVFKQNKGYRG